MAQVFCCSPFSVIEGSHFAHGQRYRHFVLCCIDNLGEVGLAGGGGEGLKFV